MEIYRRSILTVATILALFTGCYFTGGSSSPYRFLYFILLPAVSAHLTPNLIIQSGMFFTVCFSVLVIIDSPTLQDNIPYSLLELPAYLLTAIGISRMAKSISSEREHYKLAESTFNGLSNDLTQQTLNLQTTLTALSQANSKLQEIDRNKTSFLGNVAHELRTPLSAIRSYSEILQNYDDIDDNTRQEFLKIIQNESVRLSNLINDVLSMTKIESGNIGMNISQVSASQLIEECVKVMTPMAREKGLPLETFVPPENIYIMGDKSQLLQVLLNLVHNAIKFTKNGSITIGMVNGNDFVEFFVRDTGEGIFPEEKEKVFDEFYRILGNVPNRPMGSGLGLAICKNIVEYYGGTISVESEVGKGSTFRFTVPRFTDKNHDSFKPAINTKPHGSTDLRPFLVVTNNTVKRQYIRKSLEELGYITLAATTSHNARSLADRMRTDLVIADICSGQEELQALDNWTRIEDIPMFVAYFHVYSNGSLTMAMDDYISKTLEKEQILSVISRLKKPRASIVILSPDNKESRVIQVTLGLEGYNSMVFSDTKTGTNACLAAAPDGIIIGSFSEQIIDETVDCLKDFPETANIPRFMVADLHCCSHARFIPVPPQSGRPMLHGLSPLITMIETELF